MRKTTQNGLSGRSAITLLLIILISVFLIYSYSQGQVRNEQDLISKTSNALEKTRSYRFEMYSNLSMMNENFQIIRAEGQVDVVDHKMYQSIILQNHSIETVVINDQAYYRENNGLWQTEKLDGAEKFNEMLSEQHTILASAENATMSREGDVWRLEVIPKPEKVLEQMGSMGIDTSGIELKSFVTRYWIEAGTYHISEIESVTNAEMNFMGLNTPIELKSTILLSDYNYKISLEAPVTLNL
ncbi:MAG: hypothetical protein JXA98_08040 [Methanosarcinaceae archaeon]|nr:hypothetical protein [Methanosarcinaceae archaeon]